MSIQVWNSVLIRLVRTHLIKYSHLQLIIIYPQFFCMCERGYHCQPVDIWCRVITTIIIISDAKNYLRPRD